MRLKQYVYRDNSSGGEAIYVVLAPEEGTIIEADKKINKELGIKVEKTAHIGCSIHKCHDSSISIPLVISELDFWRRVHGILGEDGDHLTAIETIRDRLAIPQGWIAQWFVRFNSTCWRLYGLAPFNIVKEHGPEAMLHAIEARIEELDQSV